MVPICGNISTANVSPSLGYSSGVKPLPTPAGVPVRNVVPGRSVVLCEREETFFAMKKIKSLLLVSLRT